MTRTGTKEMAAMEKLLGNSLSTDERPPQLEPPVVPNKIDSIIHQWFTDLWLLISGEEIDDEEALAIKKDGQAFAMVCGGQMRLLGSRVSALDALRSVGVEML
jgi:hypothetical protein